MSYNFVDATLVACARAYGAPLSSAYRNFNYWKYTFYLLIIFYHMCKFPLISCWEIAYGVIYQFRAAIRSHAHRRVFEFKHLPSHFEKIYQQRVLNAADIDEPHFRASSWNWKCRKWQSDIRNDPRPRRTSQTVNETNASLQHASKCFHKKFFLTENRSVAFSAFRLEEGRLCCLTFSLKV